MADTSARPIVRSRRTEWLDRRVGVRAPLHLKVAIVYPRNPNGTPHPTYHGRTNDVSISGVSVLVEYNVFTDEEVTVLLAVPPTHPGLPEKIIEVRARMVYTVFSSEHDTFRIGLTFRGFKRNGRTVLKSLLDRCHFPTMDY